MRQQFYAFDASVSKAIRQQFAQNAAAWPSRGASRREPVQLKPGDFVLEVVSGPVPFLGDAVKGPFRVVEVRGNSVVVLTSTDFRRAEQFARHIRSLAQCWDRRLQTAAALAQ
jgi:hypothetical protein